MKSMTLGGRVRECRGERGWTQGELASRAGLSAATVSKVEQELVGKPDGETVRKLESGLGLAAGELADLPVGEPRQRAASRAEAEPSGPVGELEQIWLALAPGEDSPARRSAQRLYAQALAPVVARRLEQLTVKQLVAADPESVLALSELVDRIEAQAPRTRPRASVGRRTSTTTETGERQQYGPLRYRKGDGSFATVRSLREARGMTLGRLAEEVSARRGEGVSKGTLSAAETGQRGLSPALALQLEAVLGLDAGAIEL